MKKILFLIWAILLAMIMTAQQKEPEKVYSIEKAYAYKDEELLVTETDLYCSFFISKNFEPEFRIIAGEQQVVKPNDYSDYNNMVIDGGASNGLKEGDTLLIISKSKKIRRIGMYFGRLFQLKSIATITCLYDEQAVITIKKNCLPVNINDWVIRFKPETTVFKKKVNYRLCRIPKDAVEGEVFYNSLYKDIQTVISGPTHVYVAVDIGKPMVKRGSFILFYRQLRRDLPPLIHGLGVVVHAQELCSTVKILECTSEINIGDFVTVLNEQGMAIKEPETPAEEKIPVVEALKTETGEAGQRAEAEAGALPGFNLLFEFDSSKLSREYTSEMEQIKAFMTANADYHIILRGYCCSIGNIEYNLKLSQERVELIKDQLVKQLGADPARIETYYFGEKDAPCDNSAEAERQKNRQVRIELAEK